MPKKGSYKSRKRSGKREKRKTPKSRKRTRNRTPKRKKSVNQEGGKFNLGKLTGNIKDVWGKTKGIRKQFGISAKDIPGSIQNVQQQFSQPSVQSQRPQPQVRPQARPQAPIPRRTQMPQSPPPGTTTRTRTTVYLPPQMARAPAFTAPAIPPQHFQQYAHPSYNPYYIPPESQYNPSNLFTPQYMQQTVFPVQQAQNQPQVHIPPQDPNATVCLTQGQRDLLKTNYPTVANALNAQAMSEEIQE